MTVIAIALLSIGIGFVLYTMLKELTIESEPMKHEEDYLAHTEYAREKERKKHV